MPAQLSQHFYDVFRRISNGEIDFYNEKHLYLLFFTQLAYTSPIFIRSVLKHFDGIRGFKIYAAYGTQALRIDFDSFTQVAFRGIHMDSFMDWIKVLTFGPIDYHGVKAHRGFVYLTNKIKTDILSDLLKLRDADTYLVYTGHSLGGAMASLISLDVMPNGIVTYAAPRVSSSIDYHYHIRKFSYERIVTEYDYIRYVPMSLPFGYNHFSPSLVLPCEYPNHDILRPHHIHTYIKSFQETQGDFI